MTLDSYDLIFARGISATGPWEQILPHDFLQPHLLRTPESEGSDRFWMMEAWTESLKHHGLTQPNPAVGCVLVDAFGKEISRGLTQLFPGAHAEKTAFDRVTNSNSLVGGTAYVTLEPCAHTGRNASCADLLATSPIRRIVIARADPNPLVQGKGIQKLRAAGKDVTIGILSRELTAWNLNFLTQQILKRPLVALKWAQTLDGQLADDSMSSQWISGRTSRSYSHWLRQHYDLVLVGAQTLVSDFPQLDIRDCFRPHQGQPLPVFFDPKGILFQQPKEIQTQIKSRTLKPGRKCILIAPLSVLDKNPRSWLHGLSDLVILAQPGHSLAPELIDIISGPEVEKALGRPVQSVMIEGGSKTLTQFISAGYGDIFHCFAAPILTGGEKNRISIKKTLNQATRLHTIASNQLESDILIEMISEEVKNRIFLPS